MAMVLFALVTGEEITYFLPLSSLPTNLQVRRYAQLNPEMIVRINLTTVCRILAGKGRHYGER